MDVPDPNRNPGEIVAKTASLLEIFEKSLPRVQSRMAERLTESGHGPYLDMDRAELDKVAWSYLDPILQSLRYENDYLYTFFIDFAGDRSAGSGEPIELMQQVLDLMGELIWDEVAERSNPEDLQDNLSRLSRLLNKGKNAISGIYMRQRNNVLDELRRSNLRIIEESKKKLDILAKVSHELMTPLTSIIAYSEQLSTSVLPDEVRDDFTKVVFDQSLKLKQLIEDLLEFSANEDSQNRLNLQRADLSEVIAEAIGTVQVRAQKKDVSLIVREGQALPSVRMDAFRVQQVIWNLLTNSVKYNHPGGEVEVSCQLRGDNVLIAVADTGIGISESDLEKVFGRFHRSDDPMAVMQNGTGLGLDLARHYVNLHGGEIWVESELEKGSIFSFTLPVDGPPQFDDTSKESSLESSKTRATLPRDTREHKQLS
jgi:signal transduction histidine kinase